jgi:hypothetical protein
LLVLWPQAEGVCQNWKEIAQSDAIWRPLYVRRFRFLDPKEAVGRRKFKDLYTVGGAGG